MNNFYHCIECGNSISEGVYNFSTEVHGHPLCLRHQVWLTESAAAGETIKLYLALKSNKVDVKLEFWDGKKAIDIAIPGKLYIEVDSNQHYEADRVLNDFLSSFHAWKDKIPTFRVSNVHLNNPFQFEMIVEKLTELCREFKKTG